MNTNMTGFRCFFEKSLYFVLWPKVASALEGLRACDLLACDRYMCVDVFFNPLMLTVAKSSLTIFLKYCRQKNSLENS